MSISVRHITHVSILSIAALLLAGCTAPGTEESIEDICTDPMVLTCDTGITQPIVIIADDASDEDVTEFADRLAVAASAQSETVLLRAESDDSRVLDPEVAPLPRWEVTLEPGGSDQFTSDLAGTLAAAAVPGATRIVVAGGWHYVTVENLEQFEDVFTQVSSTPLFTHGGTYTLQALGENLRIVHVPSRTTDEAIIEIIHIAREFPGAEILLEAPTSGEQYPTLYVSRLTPAQVQEVDARLRDPRLADADVDGYALEYVLGSLGEEGTTYVGGTFGGVPTG